MTHIQIICVPQGEDRISPNTVLVDVESDKLTDADKRAVTWGEVVAVLSRFVPKDHYIVEVREHRASDEQAYRYMRNPEPQQSYEKPSVLPTLFPGQRAEMWHAGTRRFYEVEVINITTRGPLPCD